MLTRRFILTAAGSGAVVLGAAAAGVAVLAPNIRAARDPWRRAGESLGDARLDALAYAILAPNPHNRQPWLVSLHGADSLTVSCQLDRRLPQTDPYDRQIVIGFGAFLELLRMAAADMGYDAQITAFPEGAPVGRLDARPVAHVRLVSGGGEPDRLFAHVLNRRTVRTPFAPDIPDDAVLARVFSEPMTGAVAGERSRQALSDLCVEGWRIEHGHPPALTESVALTRIGAREVVASPDGISLSGPAIEAARLAGALTRQSMLESGSWANRQVFDFYAQAIEASPVFGYLLGEGDTQIDRLDAGRRWVRLHLAAAGEGVGFQPLSQVLQEFEPMQPLLEQVHGLLAPGGERVHGLFRLGYAALPDPAPRFALETRLVEATR